MRNLKHFIICALLCSFAIQNLKAQYLKGMSRDWVYEGDTNLVYLYFGNANFSQNARTSANFLTDFGNGLNSHSSFKIINDSTLQLKIALNKVSANTIISIINIDNERLEGRTIGRCNFKIVKLNPDQFKIRSIYNNPMINSDSIGDFVQIKLVGLGTHFLETETEFGYSTNGINAFNVLDSVTVISDTLAIINFPSPSKGSSGAFQIGYRNKRDGVKHNFTGIFFLNKQFGYSKIEYFSSVNQPFIYSGQNSFSKVSVTIKQTPYFNPDTLQHILQASLKLANNNGEIIPQTFLSDSAIFDSVYFSNPSFGYHQATFYFSLVIPSSLPSGSYDLVFKHPQLSDLRILNQLYIYRPPVLMLRSGASMPGLPFEISIDDSKNPLDTNGIRFEFPENSSIFIDSIIIHKGGKYLLGHLDTLSKEGIFDLKIIQVNKPEIILENALFISKFLPLIIELRPNHLLNIGRIDSSKKILTLILPSLANRFKMYLAPVRFLRNGTIDSSISIKVHPDYRSYGTVVFNVDSLAIPGYYDAEIYDTLTQKWHLQKEAIYVMNNVSRAVEISPKTVAYDGGGETRLYTCWFKNTHFSQAKEIRLGSYYHSPVVINDTCIQFRGGNADPIFYNEIDGFIGNDFLMNMVYSPSITLFSPNWIAKGSRTKFTLQSDASNWTYFKEIQFNFRKDFVYENNLKTISYKVLNDTILEFEVEAGDSLTGTYDLRIDQYPPNTFSGETIFLEEALWVVPVGIGENNKGSNSIPMLVPNPNKGEFEIISNNNSFQSYEITDILGKSITSGSLDQTKTQFDLSKELKQSGIYFIKLSGEKTITLKFIFNP